MGRSALRGCHRDAEQTHESLVPYLVEEAHETLHAIESGDRAQLAEQLGPSTPAETARGLTRCTHRTTTARRRIRHVRGYCCQIGQGTATTPHVPDERAHRLICRYKGA